MFAASDNIETTTCPYSANVEVYGHTNVCSIYNRDFLHSACADCQEWVNDKEGMDFKL